MTEEVLSGSSPIPEVESADEAPDTETARSDQSWRREALWRTIIVAVLATFVGFLVIGLNRTNESGQRASGEAPVFEFTTFDGATISSTELLGQGVVLNYWASWCNPCRDEAALLESTWRREEANGIVFIGLDYLDQEHSALAYLAEFDITYPNGPDIRSAAARRYGIKGVPETFFIGPDGTIVDHVIGPILNQADMDQRLANIRP
jgi:cytochrome c biogenesis protein CcmG/thiol:disulfide interchange protein DsbE